MQKYMAISVNTNEEVYGECIKPNNNDETQVYLEQKQTSLFDGQITSFFIPVWKNSVVEISQELSEELDDIGDR